MAAPDRWQAAIRLQRVWRAKLARIRVKKLMAERKQAIADRFSAADRLEAAIQIQTLLRRFFARARVARMFTERRQRQQEVEQDRVKEVFDISEIPAEFFVFSSPPTDHQLRRLFDSIDLARRGVVSRRHCVALYEHFVGPSAFGVEEPRAATERILRSISSPFNSAFVSSIRGAVKNSGAASTTLIEEAPGGRIISGPNAKAAPPVASRTTAAAAVQSAKFDATRGVIAEQAVGYDQFCLFVLKLLSM